MEVTVDSIKNIKISQHKKGYRFTIDSLLLADFVNKKNVEKIADLGAGSGIIGILLAGKYSKSRVLLIEIQKELAALAMKNIELNALTERVEILGIDINDIPTSGIKENSFDLIVSNPPFRTPVSGRVSPLNEKAIARHEIMLSLSSMIKSAFYMLKGKGRASFIYSTSRFIEVLEELKRHNMEPKRVRFIHSNRKSEAKMFIIEAIKEGGSQFTLEMPFFIYNENGNYTEEAMALFNCE